MRFALIPILLLFATVAHADIALVFHAEKAGTSAGSGATTDAVDSTGCSLLVAGYASRINIPTLTDSKSNAWTALTEYAPSSSRVRLYYCAAPTVGSGHTFSVSGGSATYGTVFVLGFSGTAATPFDKESGSGGTGGTSRQPGSVTPASNGSVLVSMLSASTTTTNPLIDGSYTAHALSGTGVNQNSGIAYLIQTTATASNPTWSWTGNDHNAATIAVFSPAASGSAVPAIMQHYQRLRNR